MKLFLFYCVTLLSFTLQGQNYTKGEKIEGLKFTNIINSEKEQILLSEFKDKIVILEFWATWCGPCIPAMEKLSALKEQFGEDIEIIGITYDSRERIEKYLTVKPSNIKYISDLNNDYKKLFPHHSIPHSIIIGKNNVFLAETLPEQLTSDIISELIKTNTFKGTSKVTISRAGFDYTKDYFPLNGNETNRFLLQPPIENGMPLVKKFRKGVFKDRRITFMNSSIFNILKFAYGLNAENTYRLEGIDIQYLQSKVYCLDVLVEENKNLKAYLKSKIKDAFPDVKLSLEEKSIDVLELIRHPSLDLALIRSTANSSQKSNNNVTRVSSYHKTNVTLDDFTNDYLNKFISPIFKKPIINSTYIEGYYDIDFEFALEDPKSFKKELSKLGLKLTPSKKEKEILVIAGKL